MLLFAAVYLLAVWTAPGQRLEDGVLQAAVAGGGRRAATDVLHALTGWALAVGVVAVAVIGWVRGGRLLAVAGVGLVAVSVGTVEVLQVVLPRPTLLHHGYFRQDHGYPSGHTCVAVSVMCALILVAAHRYRALLVLLGSLSATGVGALTVTAAWHRPSDTLGSDLVVLAYLCLAVRFLEGRGRLRSTPPLPGRDRTVAALIGAEAVVLLAAGLVLGVSALHTLSASQDPEDLVLRSALDGGRATALAGGACVALALLWLLRGHETGHETGTAGGLSGQGPPPDRPTREPTGRAS